MNVKDLLSVSDDEVINYILSRKNRTEGNSCRIGKFYIKVNGPFIYGYGSNLHERYGLMVYNIDDLTFDYIKDYKWYVNMRDNQHLNIDQVAQAIRDLISIQMLDIFE
jgi:hypothetical protein